MKVLYYWVIIYQIFHVLLIFIYQVILYICIYIYLLDCKIGNEGVKVISKGLLNCPDLVKIDLGSNLITDEGAKYISVTIKSLSRLEKVNMGRNNLSNQGKSILNDCSIDKPNLTVLV